MADEPKVMNRWWVVVGALLVQLCLGAIYAWSVFTSPLTATPVNYVPVFTAAQLGLAKDKYVEVKTAVGRLQDELKALDKTVKTETDQAKLADLKAKKNEAISGIQGILDANIEKGKIDKLKFGFTKTDTQIIFSVGLLIFAVVMALVAGNWQKKAGPRLVSLVGGVILGLGYLLAGFAGSNFWGILIGVGILGGAGIGLGYVCPIASLVKWFPDKKGFITGLAVAGFGFGALLWIKLNTGFKFGAKVDLTPGWEGFFGMGMSVSQVFMLYGAIFAVLVGIGSLFLANPPEGWKPAGWTPPTGTAASASGAMDFTVGQMIKTPQYWTLFMTFVTGALAGLMVIGVIDLFGRDALTTRGGIDAKQAGIIAGTAMGLFYALMNGFGRIIWGWLSDIIGRKNSIVLMTMIQGVMMVLFYHICAREWCLYLGAAIIGFNFGGNFALFPAATADYFGNKNVGTNYPWVFMAYGVGGVVGPILGGVMGDARAWMWAFIPAGIACLVMAVAAMTLKPPQVKPADA